MKKATMLLISFVLLFGVVLAGCGGAKTDTSASTSTPAPAATATPAPAETPKPAGAVDDAHNKEFTIRVGAWFIDDRTFMQDFKKNVEANYKKIYPKATIQWDVILSATYFDKLKAQFASDSAPDVVFNQTPLVYAEGGYLMDLSDQPWVSKFKPDIKKSFVYKATKDEFKQYDGKLYAVSMGVGVAGVWYNKKIFADLGIAVPKTTAEFFAACEKIKKSGVTPIGLGFKDAWTADFFDQLWLQSIGYGSSETFGRDLFEGKKKLDGTEVQTVMKNFETLKQNDYVNKNALSIDWPQSAEMFTSGKSAMIVQGSWMPAVSEDNFVKKGHARFDLGFFPLMDEKGHTEVAPSTDHALSINAKTKLVQEAKDLVSVIISPEIYAPYDNGSGTAPALDGIDVKYTNAVMNEVNDAMKTAKTHNAFNAYIGSGDGALVDVVTKIVSGVKFNPGDLKAAVDKFNTDKAKITPPAE